MREIKFGAAGHLSDADLNRAAVQFYEQQGYDFVIWADQMSMFVPRSIWTPDIVPAAESIDIDAHMDPFALITDAAVNTESIELGITVMDPFRRTPGTYAQFALTMDHFSKGRYFLAMGTGEMRHFSPYGLERPKPYTHLEEAVKIIKLLMESDGPVDYEGPIWNLDRALMTLPPYGDSPPPIFIAGAGRSQKIAGQYGDGWITMLPHVGSPEQYAEEVAKVKRYAEEAGRDPDAIAFYALVYTLIDNSEEALEEYTRHPIMRFDTAAMVTDPKVYESWGFEHPIRPDYTYARDAISQNWSREDALAVAEAVPPEAVRKARFVGNPKEVADRLQPYIEAGCNWLNILNYTSFVGSGDFGDAVEAQGLVTEVMNDLRERNGQGAPTAAAPATEDA
jgi:phthiodiolone/phenolphthiodiolone dimycocerosates ketoreductase